MKTLLHSSEVSSNFTSSTAQKMNVDASGMAHIMSLLTDLYSNINLAVLREYSTNALDSHRTSGQTRPIEVTLPSALEPTLVIRDYGLGLSEEEIYCVYAQYGASTKRDSNDQIGAFGLGCKSALALSTQFTVSAIKNGKKITVLFVRGEDGVGTVDVLHRSDTEEGNGVTVSVPVKNPDAMRKESVTFFRAWDPNTVLIDGVAPDSILEDAMQVTDKTYVKVSPNQYFSYGAAKSYVIMGSVPYPLEGNMQSVLSNNIVKASRDLPRYAVHAPLVLKVGIGEVDLIPSREALRYTERTKRALEALILEFSQNIKNKVIEDVNSTSTITDALKRANLWRAQYDLNLQNHSFEWNGQKIGRTISFENKQVGFFFGEGRKTNFSDAANVSDVSLSPAPSHCIIITGADSLLKRQQVSKNMRDYIKNNGSLQREGIALFDSPDLRENYWTEPSTGLFTYVDIEQIIEQAREYRRSRRVSASASRGINTTPVAREEIKYPVLSRLNDVISVNNLSVSELRNVETSLYYVAEPKNSYSTKLFASVHPRQMSYYEFALSVLPLNSAIVTIDSGRSVEAFTRRFPKAQDFSVAYVKAAQEFVDGLSDNERNMLSVITSGMSSRVEATLVEKLKLFTQRSSEIKNKKFLDELNWLLDFTSKSDGYRAMTQKVQRLNFFSSYVKKQHHDILVAPFVTRFSFASIFKSFPLINCVLSQNSDVVDKEYLDDMVSYVNSVQKKK